MHGPLGSYARNGHTRSYSFASQEGKHLGSMNVGSHDILTHVCGVVIEITREQANAIIEQHRKNGAHIKLDIRHNAHCICQPNDPRLQPFVEVEV